MGKVEIHFFHGFLGNRSDWQPVIECLKTPSVCHSLIEDSQNIIEKLSFENWAKYKTTVLKANDSKKIVIGYSMGGRLAMHLPPETYEKLVLIGAHPGLEEGKEVRLKQDFKWKSLLEKTSTEEWLSLWNRQEIFSSDSIRPKRNFTKQDLDFHLDLQQIFSLGLQESQWKKLKVNAAKISWGCGEKDMKYQAIKKQLAKCIGQDKVFSVPNSGHGVLFDNPQDLAKKILKVVASVC